MSMSQPGWHQVPGSNQERYWDGQRWTDTYRPATPGAPPMYPSLATGLEPRIEPPSGRNHGPAIASMVLGIVSIPLALGCGAVTAIVGLVLGATSLKHVQPRGPHNGRGMAIAGIVCSIVALALLVVLVGVIVLTDGFGDE